MATGFRNPTRTQSGRKVTLSEKARALLASSVWKTVLESATVMEHSANELSNAVEDRRSKKLVAVLHNAWVEVRIECDDLIAEFWDLASPDEQSSREDDIEGHQQRAQEVAEMVNAYLAAETEEEKTKPSFGSTLLEKEVKVRAEIDRIKKQISSLSLKSPPPPSTQPSASWVTTSRCDGDPTPPPTGASRAQSAAPAEPRPAPAAAVRTDVGSNADDLIVKLTRALTENKDLLQRMEPDVFSGDMLKYPMWISSFEALIERRTECHSQRLFFLGRFTAGEAHEAISGYLTLFSSDPYDRAKKLLNSRYGDRLKVAQAYRNKLFGWKAVKKNDGPALQQYADFLWQCSAAMDSIGHLDSLNSAEENARMVRVLPQYIVEKWFRLVDRWYYRYDGDDDDGGRSTVQTAMFPPFEEFCRLIATEARIINGPAYKLSDQPGDKNAKVPEAKPDAKKSGRRAQSFASGAKETRDQPREKKNKPTPACFYCREVHYLNKCDEFMKLTCDERKEFAAQNHLCFGCLGRGHGYRDCKWKNPALLGEPSEDPMEDRL